MTFSAPTFSVVIPVFNRAGVVHRTINSVLAQTYDNYEIIVVDDGSTDELNVALSRFSDNRLKLVTRPNGGGGRARNTGIDAAQGRYIAFLDSDDEFLPHHLETMNNILGGSDKVVAYSQVVVNRGNGKTFVKPPRGLQPGETMAEYLCCSRGFIQTSTLVVPTSFARKVRYREGMRFGQDTDFAIRLALADIRFVMAPEPGAVWTDIPDPTRVSSLRKGASNLPWIQEMRPLISAKAYHGYRGWHIAKGIAKTSKWEALKLFLTALRYPCYTPRLAFVILCQIFISDEGYRRFANGVLRLSRSRTEVALIRLPRLDG